jgi:HK97 family phage prohead protease
MQHKKLTAPIADFKVMDDQQGIVEAIVSVFGNRDYAGDRVLPGFFQDSLAKKLPKIVFSHDWNRPIGKTLEAKELLPGDPMLPKNLADMGGLWVRGQLNLDVQDGKDVLSHLKFGSLDEFSFGYDVEQEQYNAKDKVNDLIKGTIYEWSPVLVGCNPATALLGVKSVTGSKSLPLGDRDETWSASEARKGLKGDDETPSAQYKKAHMVCDGDPDNFTSYKLPFGRLDGDELKAVWKGVTSAAAALQGSRGGVDLSDEDRTGAKAICEAYYKKARSAYNDESIKVPWSDDSEDDDNGKALQPFSRKALAERIARKKGCYLGAYAEASASFEAIYDLWYSFCYGPLIDALYGDGDDDEDDNDPIAYLAAAFDEFRDISLAFVQAMRKQSDGMNEDGMNAGTNPQRDPLDLDTEDEPSTYHGFMSALSTLVPKRESQNHTKTIPTVHPAPAPAAGTFSEDLEAALAAAQKALARGQEVAKLRAKNGRTLSTERRAQLAELSDSLTALLKASAPIETLSVKEQTDLFEAYLREAAEMERVLLT